MELSLLNDLPCKEVIKGQCWVQCFIPAAILENSRVQMLVLVIADIAL